MAIYLSLLDIALGMQHLHNDLNILHGGELASPRDPRAMPAPLAGRLGSRCLQP
jgi:hypothetical protein